LLGEDIKEANEDAFDAIMEIGNMVAGSIKDALDGSSYEITAISVPALVLGASYEVYFARGITAVSVDFELTDMPFSWHRDRIMSTSVSLLRRSGGAK
jgi:CheY-specific phosphatase CheX